MIFSQKDIIPPASPSRWATSLKEYEFEDSHDVIRLVEIESSILGEPDLEARRGSNVVFAEEKDVEFVGAGLASASRGTASAVTGAGTCTAAAFLAGAFEVGGVDPGGFKLR